MTLFIDPREGSKDLISIHPIPDLSPVHCPLNSGDVAFCGKGPNNSSLFIGLELKEISEFVSSLQSQRLQGGQLPRMIRDYSIRYLLIYGRIRASPKDGKSLQIYRSGSKLRREGWYSCNHNGSKRETLYSTVQAFLHGPSLWAAGIQPLHVEDKSEAAQLIATLYRVWNKPWHKHNSLKALDNSQDPSGRIRKEMKQAIAVGLPHNLDEKFAERLKFANAIPNIGYERAYAIAGYFPSVKAMVLASKEEWSMVEVQTSSGRTLKIGPVMARAIVEYFS